MYAELKRKRCSKCKQELDPSLFHNSKKSSDGKTSACRECRLAYRRQPEIRKKERAGYTAWRNADKERAKRLDFRNNLRVHFGLTVEQYTAMVEAQNGVCAICGKPESHPRKKNLAVDHCHTTGKIRGLLCNSCNTGIGLLKEDERLFLRTIEYLKQS